MMTIKEEQLWLARAAAGDTAAMELLLDTYEGLLECAARQEHLRPIREDALSVGRLWFMEAVRRYEPTRGTCFAAYAKSLVYGGIRTFFRREQKRWNRELLPAPGNEQEESPLEAVPDEAAAQALERATLKESLRAAFHQLTAEERRLLGLTFLQGLSQRKAARLLGMPQQTLSFRQGKALKHLRLLMEA